VWFGCGPEGVFVVFWGGREGFEGLTWFWAGWDDGMRRGLGGLRR
jgi:hypothetical protein